METTRIRLRDEETLKHLLRHLERGPTLALPEELVRDLKMFLREVSPDRLRIREGND